MCDVTVRTGARIERPVLFRAPGGTKHSSLHQIVHIGCGVQPRLLSSGYRGSVPDGRAAKRWNWPPSSIWRRG